MESNVVIGISYWYVASTFSLITFGTHQTHLVLAYCFAFMVCGLVPNTSATLCRIEGNRFQTWPPSWSLVASEINVKLEFAASATGRRIVSYEWEPDGSGPEHRAKPTPGSPGCFKPSLLGVNSMQARRRPFHYPTRMGGSKRSLPGTRSSSMRPLRAKSPLCYAKGNSPVKLTKPLTRPLVVAPFEGVSISQVPNHSPSSPTRRHGLLDHSSQ